MERFETFLAKEQRGLNKKEVKEVLGLAADLADMMQPVDDIAVRAVWKSTSASGSSRRRVDGVEERAITA